MIKDLVFIKKWYYFCNVKYNFLRDSVRMEDVVKIASYICQRYQVEFGERIDEMKLHKLLYFAQRESLIQLDEPLFSAQFEAWKYGPVLVEIRQLYKDDKLHESLSSAAIEKFAKVFDKVFSQYAKKDSWSLSLLTHGEYSWQEARHGIGDDEPCSVLIRLDDIRKDAQRIKMRRFVLKHCKFSIS